MREIRERLRSRAYVISTGVLVVLLGVGLVLPKVVSAPETRYRFGVVGTPPAGLALALRQAAAAGAATVTLHRYPTAGAARDGLDAGSLDALLRDRGAQIVFRRDVNDTMVAIARQALARLALPARLDRAGLSPAQFARLVEPPRMRVHTLRPGGGVDAKTAQLVALGGASLMLMAISLYGSWVMAGVAQEKTGRVAELLVAAIRPRDLLAGKVLGVGLLGLAQVAIFAAVVAAATAVGITDLPSSFVPAAMLVVPWFVLGFALYAVGFAVAGAVVTRQEDVATVSIPVTGVMILSFFLSYGALQAAPGSAFTHFATLFPATAPFMVPGRSAISGVPLWEHALALGLTLAALYGLVRLGGRLYTAALLHSSPLSGLSAVWRLRG